MELPPAKSKPEPMFWKALDLSQFLYTPKNLTENGFQKSSSFQLNMQNVGSNHHPSGILKT